MAKYYSDKDMATIKRISRATGESMTEAKKRFDKAQKAKPKYGPKEMELHKRVSRATGETMTEAKKRIKKQRKENIKSMKKGKKVYK